MLEGCFAVPMLWMERLTSNSRQKVVSRYRRFRPRQSCHRQRDKRSRIAPPGFHRQILQSLFQGLLDPVSPGPRGLTPTAGDRDSLTKSYQGFGAAVVPERILESQWNDCCRRQTISQMTDALLESDGSISRINEFALSGDPEDRLWTRQRSPCYDARSRDFPARFRPQVGRILAVPETDTASGH